MMQETTLQSLQQHFTECLFDRDKDVNELPLTINKESDNNKRLDIYRNNVFYSLTAALGDLYPVVKKLTGAEFFNGTARAYLQQHPPEKAAMVFFAENFPEFLEVFEHSKDQAWLADVSRLELAWHQSYHAVDAEPLTPEQLSDIPPEQLALSTIALHPSVRLVHSPYPILQIWNANQDDQINEDTIDLDSGGESLCLFRPEFNVLIKKLGTGFYGFLNRLQAGMFLEQAIVLATEVDPDFAADQVLAQCLSEGLFLKINQDKTA